MVSVRSYTSLILFATGVALIGSASLYVATQIPQSPAPDLLASAMTFDLVVLIPLAYYLLLVRRRGWPVFSVAPVFLVSLGLAGLIVPDDHQALLQVFQMLVVPVELFLLGYIGVHAYRAVQHLRTTVDHVDVLDRLAAAAQQIVPSPKVARVMAYELGVVYYALGTWRQPRPEGARVFSYHRRTGYPAVLVALLLVAVVELVAVHVLVARWSPLAAWILTLLSAYGTLWIMAELQASLLRPIEVREGQLMLRSGLRWTVRIPLTAIVALRPTTSTDDEAEDILDIAPLGASRFEVAVRTPVVAEGPYGICKTVTRVRFTVDDHARFEGLMREVL
jgi:hypothetical protein